MTTVYLLLLSMGLGFLSDLWSFCLGDPNRGELKRGRIFSWLGSWLMKQFKRFEDETERQTLSMRQSMYRDAVAKHRLWAPGQPIDVNENDFDDIQAFRTNWWKVTGLCPRCFNVWLASLVWVLACFAMPETGWWFRCLGYFVFVAVAHVALSIAERLRG